MLPRIAWAMALLSLTGCVWVQSGRTRPMSVAAPAIFDEMAVTGVDLQFALPVRPVPVYGDVTNFRAALSNPPVGAAPAVQADERIDLRITLAHALEEARITKRVVDHSSTRVEAEITHAGPSTGPLMLAWDVANAVSLAGFVGLPFLGQAKVEVRLRAYDRDQLRGSWSGEGRAVWRAHFQPWKTISAGRREALLTAAQAAMRNAVAKMSRTPPTPMKRSRRRR